MKAKTGWLAGCSKSDGADGRQQRLEKYCQWI
jgi:hypothetical protein